MNKNDIVQLKIEDMNTDGEGVGKADGYTLFVKDTVIGDTAKVLVTKTKKTYGYGRLVELITPSPFRVPCACPIARPCGGCQLQAMSYEKQLEFKEEKVRGNLKRIGGFKDIPMEPIIGMESPWRYRNKAQIPVGRDKNGRLVAGFYAGRTHAIINQEDCLLGSGKNGSIVSIVKQFMEQYNISPYDEETGKGLVRHILIREGFRTGEIMVCLVLNGRKLPHKEALVKRLLTVEGMKDISINVNTEPNNVILGKELISLYGEGFITDYIGNVKYRISPLSFYQVNPRQTEKLYGTALEYAALTGEETVWDLYCGIGTISLFLAQKAKKVYGVEIVEAAIEDARNNARINGLSNAEFFVGRAEDVLPEKYKKEHIHADVIVIDPPRKGCEESVLDTMVQMAPKRIVYVSCDSATLARDLKYLCGKGYELKRVRAVDMFGQTGHVETVCLLSKLQTKQHIEIDLDMDELDLTSAEKKATYQEIKDYVLEHSGLKVSSLYIAQAKQKCGIIERENYNKPKSEDVKQPQCPLEKETAIMEALRHFGMI